MIHTSCRNKILNRRVAWLPASSVCRSAIGSSPRAEPGSGTTPGPLVGCTCLLHTVFQRQCCHQYDKLPTGGNAAYPGAPERCSAPPGSYRWLLGRAMPAATERQQYANGLQSKREGSGHQACTVSCERADETAHHARHFVRRPSISPATHWRRSGQLPVVSQRGTRTGEAPSYVSVFLYLAISVIRRGLYAVGLNFSRPEGLPVPFARLPLVSLRGCSTGGVPAEPTHRRKG